MSARADVVGMTGQRRRQSPAQPAADASAAADRRRSDRGRPAARRAARRSRRTDPRSSAPCPARGGPSAPSTIASSIAASTSRAPGKNRDDRRVPVLRWSWPSTAAARIGTRLARQPVEALRLRAFAPQRPQLIRQVLLHQRNLRLHRQHDVPQRRGRPAIGRHAGEHPRAALLVHQAARAVDRVDDDPPVGRRLVASPPG